jgi:hypothetical protein
MEKRLDMPDVLFGTFLCVVGAVTLLATRHLTFGTPADMGAGFMPRILALSVAGFGLYFVGRGLLRPRAEIRWAGMRPLFSVLGAVAVFTLIAAKGGLALAALATILVASMASRETRFGELFVFGVVLSAATVLLFVKALSLPIPVWPW